LTSPQVRQLAMVGLGLRDDQPPYASWPRLEDGIHLRWAAAPELGFPWYGYHLFRRKHLSGELTDLGPEWTAAASRGRLAGRRANLPSGRLVSDRPLVLVNVPVGTSGRPDSRGSPATPGSLPARALTLGPGGGAGASHLTFHFRPGRVARRLVAVLRLEPGAEVRVTALSGLTPVGEEVVKNDGGGHGGPGAREAKVRFAFDWITSLRFEVESSPGGGPSAGADLSHDPSPPPALLLELAYVPVWQEAGRGWTPLGGFPYPLGLPVAERHYPLSCPSSPRAEEEALARVEYGEPGRWAGRPFQDLHRELKALVRGGPTGPAMASVSRVVAASAGAGSDAPRMLAQRPLDLVLAASLHPAMAQMLGLYWFDRTAEPGVSYDYLLVGAFTAPFEEAGLGKLGPSLERDEGRLSSGHLAYIAFDLKTAPAKPLPAPGGLRAFALPGSFVRGPDGRLLDWRNVAGLRWETGVGPAGGLLPGRPVLWNIWRADLGPAEMSSPPPPENYSTVTENLAVVAARAGGAPETGPARGDGSTAGDGSRVSTADRLALPPVPGWPPGGFAALDGGMPDGWYSYRVSGIDLFGRQSPLSRPGQWWQWAPCPDPKPWYYRGPSRDARVHPFAVRLLDKSPPPPPAGVEAFVLDPGDPLVVKDAPYLAWREAMRDRGMGEAIGLRVRFAWVRGHMDAAPDTKEFRVYFHGGGDLPGESSGRPRASAAWDHRLFVIPYDHPALVERDPAGREVARRYDVFWPSAGEAPSPAVLPLSTTLARPIAWAHVGVTAADDRDHTGDAVKWSGTSFGDRPGNESLIGGPAKVVLVRRRPPPTPVPVPPDSDRVYATPADYHGRSFYTYRWRPGPPDGPPEGLPVHVYRALDSSIFQEDWARRPRPALSATDAALFPREADEPAWTAGRRERVASELNRLNTFPRTGEGAAQATAYYRALSQDALRVMAGLPGLERAFAPVTARPLDPADSATANRVGPDNPPTFAVDRTLRAYVDTLDGGSTNAYFYRVAYLDAVHNQSALSLAGPPVWLPNVVPPRVPVVTAATGGDRRVTLRWVLSREADLAEYRVYRAPSSEEGRDLRLMTLAFTWIVPAGEPETRPAEATWEDSGLPGLKTFYYRLVAVDTAGNVSQPCAPVVARSFDEAPPAIPRIVVAWVENAGSDGAEAGGGNSGCPSIRITWTGEDESLLERRRGGVGFWEKLGDWRGPGVHLVVDTAPDPVAGSAGGGGGTGGGGGVGGGTGGGASGVRVIWQYRLRLRKSTGATALSEPVSVGPRP
jgi:hypothetical protein